MQYLHPAFSYHHQVLIAFLLAAALQQDQTPRPVVKNERGMLPVNKTYFDLAANTGGDIYFWAPGEFASAKLQVPLPGVPVVLSYGSTLTSRACWTQYSRFVGEERARARGRNSAGSKIISAG